ncbi:MAG: N-acetylmuramidase domain-containing protein [Magnetococcus sp. YQC-5]
MSALAFAGKGLALSSDGIADVCDLLQVKAAEVWSVLRVETSGKGFLSDRRPQILFERHIFSKRTNHQYDATHPGISSPTPGGYGNGGANQYTRLNEAIALNREAALESASWGIGQVMGFNATSVNYPNATAMIHAMVENEDAQLMAMARFIVNNKLARALTIHDWASFARGYNGSNYAINQYDAKLASEYQRLATRGLPDLTVRAVQLYLTYLGYDPHGVDGFAGRFTNSAVADFLAASQLPAGLPMDQVLQELQKRL